MHFFFFVKSGYLFRDFVTSSTLLGEGLKITRPGRGGGGRQRSIVFSAPVRARNTKLRGQVCLYKDPLSCKFDNTRSNDVIIAKFYHFSNKSADL